MAADRNLPLRVASAVVGLPILGALVLWREPLPFFLFTLLVCALGLVEYTGMTLPGRPLTERAAVVAVGVALCSTLSTRPDLALVAGMAAVVAIGILTLARPEEIPTASARLTAKGFGVFYLGGLLAALPLLHRREPHGSLWVIVALAVTFANDTGAYFVGRALGRHKLAPLVSPGKSVEGAVGGLCAGLGFMFAARATFFPALTALDAALIGGVGGIVGPAGDLMESLLKRSAGVKDSGRLIPGHGGMLDRIDAVLFVSAYVYAHVALLH